jgi:lipid A 3-O-deacylase
LTGLIRNLAAISLAFGVGVTAWAQSEAKPLDNPAAEVRDHRSWEFGPFVNGGTGVSDRSDYQFFWAGFQVGKALTPVVKAGPLSGQFELGMEVIPLWQAYTPSPHPVLVTLNGVPTTLGFGGGRYTGFSIEPVIFRWNFATRSRRFEPWAQAAAGSLYTTHKFPPEVLVPKGTPGGTSVFNFTPQGGVGFHYFVKPRRSWDVGVNAEHISSASLGDKNPGVNASIQVQIGYTWWK